MNSGYNPATLDQRRARCGGKDLQSPLGDCPTIRSTRQATPRPHSHFRSGTDAGLSSSQGGKLFRGALCGNASSR
jgi:hypothetical protein